MSYTQWILAQQADLSFRFVAQHAYARFHIGDGVIRGVAGDEARLVDLVLRLDLQNGSEVINTEYRRFPLLRDGRRDPVSLDWELSLMRTTVGCSMTDGRRSSAEYRWATRQLACGFRWTPTDSEQRAIADMVSRRAKQPLLGGRLLRLV